jgi:8-oxo-dGTP pyrophosphatase MutT (NUDIX family)
MGLSYIHDLRQLIGKYPLIMVGASLLMLNQRDQLLMLKKNDNGRWGVPGGAMELGESLEETARRETKEEIGVDVKDIELFGIYSGQELYYCHPNGEEVYNVSVVYLVRNFRETIKVNCNEHSEYQYFDLRNLPKDISPPIRPILRDLVHRAAGVDSVTKIHNLD